MLSWFIRALLLLSGVITGWLVARDAHQFEVMQMIVAVFLFVIGIAAAAFWPLFVQWVKNHINHRHQ